ncbi:MULTISPECIES: hypothetical protein [Pectobacterium]|uniref:Uncharacterized protein n=1 Tax=Pectobacterium aquaticum TaxID=2204145 RepID=A0AA93AQ64_9GAMM|nr:MULTISPECIES: hypothetical protein [Pectobacterium]MDQ5891842.1 hypothetical protein [Pseudomonadota bacterium]PLY35521.1 hypothetical protein F164LOC_19960 [Pectobacterium carotovorum]MCH5051846.1 hypothetical protein [Pectobacterium aquaticum]RRN95872.1 hypothetical protein DMB79_013245 [Pectobacterium aquaticum]RRO05296.1 hypothetical protein DMB83_001740 [Pectobacterium aquaticum]
MDNPIQWLDPFNDEYQNGMVYRKFILCGKLYGVGFQELSTSADLEAKQINLQHAFPRFDFPLNSGVWVVLFDAIDPITDELLGFRHVQLEGLAGGRVLFNVASIIYDHYTICNAGVYVFSAAEDREHERGTDLAVIYSRALGLQGHRKGMLFGKFVGWNAYTDVDAGGRSYVVTTESY